MFNNHFKMEKMNFFTNSLKTTFLICFFYLSYSPVAQAQGPWLQEKGTGFLQVQTTVPMGTYKDLLIGTEYEPINREVLNLDLGIYGVYGLTDKLTIISQLPFKYVSTGSTTSDSLANPILLEEGNLAGMSNLYFAAKYKVWDKGLKVAVSAQTNLNTISNDLDKGLSTGYMANFYSLFAHVGGGVTSKLYAFADVGYTLGTNGYSNYTSLYLESGYKVTKRTYVILNASIKTSLKNGDFDNGNLLQTGLYPNDQDWVSMGLKVFYETDKNIGFTLGSAILAQANYIGPVAALSFGVFKKW